jgi:hypothetical protein
MPIIHPGMYRQDLLFLHLAHCVHRAAPAAPGKSIFRVKPPSRDSRFRDVFLKKAGLLFHFPSPFQGRDFFCPQEEYTGTLAPAPRAGVNADGKERISRRRFYPFHPVHPVYVLSCNRARHPENNFSIANREVNIYWIDRIFRMKGIRKSIKSSFFLPYPCSSL